MAENSWKIADSVSPQNLGWNHGVGRGETQITIPGTGATCTLECSLKKRSVALSVKGHEGSHVEETPWKMGINLGNGD